MACSTVFEKRQVILGLTGAFRRPWEWRLLDSGASPDSSKLARAEVSKAKRSGTEYLTQISLGKLHLVDRLPS